MRTRAPSTWRALHLISWGRVGSELALGVPSTGAFRMHPLGKEEKRIESGRKEGQRGWPGGPDGGWVSAPAALTARAATVTLSRSSGGPSPGSRCRCAVVRLPLAPRQPPSFLMRERWSLPNPVMRALPSRPHLTLITSQGPRLQMPSFTGSGPKYRFGVREHKRAVCSGLCSKELVLILTV